MARRTAGSHQQPRPANLAGGEGPTTPIWEALYQSALPALQSEWLALANRQGILYAHQLAASANGDCGSPDRCRHLLALVFGGRADQLETVDPGPLPGSHDELDSTQLTAVAHALSTPDFFLLQGFPGTGKSRVVAEVVARAVARGERVLLVAPSAAAIDRVLELLGDRGPVCGLRILGREERPESLPTTSRAFTLAEQSRRLRDQALPAARHQIEVWEQRGRLHSHDEAVLTQLQPLADRRSELDAKAEALRRRHAEVPGQVHEEFQEVAKPATNPRALTLQTRAAVCTQTQARLDAALDELRQKCSQQQKDVAVLEAQFNVLRPLAEAKKSWRFWTATWWRALRHPTVNDELASLELRHQQAQAALEQSGKEAERLIQQRREASELFDSERLRLIAEEAHMRQAEIDAQASSLPQLIESLEQEWRARCGELSPASPRPTEMRPEAVRQARALWQDQSRHDQASLAFAREWVNCLEQTAQCLAERLPGYVNLVAATTTTLATDALFGDGSLHGSGFDTLLLEEADQLTEAEFLALARRARRWLLVGEPEWERGRRGTDDPGLPGARKLTPDEAARPVPRAGCFFHRLWQHLHCDPRRLPYTWAHEQNKLCCRLTPVKPEQRACLESERVVDFPDIELRILTLPNMPPRLAEVVFPPSMSIIEAKEYIYRELEELPVRASASSLRWTEETDRIVLHLAETPASETAPVVLEAGVRELVGTGGGHPGPTDWQTCRVEFDRSQGWQRQQAAEWVQRHLGLRDLGRTAWLRTPHRMHPGLAAFLADVVIGTGYRLPAVSTAQPPGLDHSVVGKEACQSSSAPGRLSMCQVEFVPVPAPTNAHPSAHRRGPGGPNGNHQDRTLPSKGGAGLELAPADLRHPDRLPAELRAGLPNHGFVNYVEAQAMVASLEALLADPALRGTAASLGTDTRPSLAVIALYPAQAELIRRLLAQAPAVATSGVNLEVGTPADFRQRECLVGLVSLTRSHTHRAVVYGEHPRMLALALTRARRKLILFGDPGTLLRRAQWQGPLEHLDETSAAQERELLLGLAHYVQGGGHSPGAFLMHEGSGP